MASEAKYSSLNEYESRMWEMKKRALAAAAAHKLSRYMGIFGLTWATVVVLGGFAQELHTLDFAIVSALLLLQAARFAVSSTFGRLPSARLFSEQHHPDEFSHRDYQYYWASLIHVAGQIWSSSIAAAAIAVAVFRLASLGPLSLSLYHHTRNVVRCLVTFYILAIFTSVLAIVTVFLQFRRGSSISTSSNNLDGPSVAFYDAVYQSAIDSELASAFNLSLLEFAFDKLRSDLMRGIQPLAIERCNRRLVNYIYDVPTGIERAYHYLETSDDMYRQLVAVNLARFWADRPRINKQIAYFVEVGRKLGRPEKLAEAASYAIERLGDKWADCSPNWLDLAEEKPRHDNQNGYNGAQHVSIEIVQMQQQCVQRDGRHVHPFLEAQLETATGKTIVDFLAELVINPLRSSLVFQLRALESCCRSRGVADWIRGRDYYQELCLKLVRVVEEESRSAGRPRQRTKIYAASALFHLLPRTSPIILTSPPGSAAKELDGGRRQQEALLEAIQERLRMGLKNIHPADSSEKYVWKKEKELLDCLRKELGLEAYEWGKLKIKNPEDLRN